MTSTRQAPQPVIQLIPGISWSGLRRMATEEGRKAENDFAQLRAEIRRRDEQTCLGCGIWLPETEDCPSGGLDVHHINANPTDNRPMNLATLCPFCHGVFHIGKFARRFGRGMRLIFCPELGQRELNLLTWAMGIVFYRTGQECSGEEEKLRLAVELLRNRLLKRTTIPSSYCPICGDLLNQVLKEKDDLTFFATLLGLIRSKNPEAYAARGRWLGGLRIWYDPGLETIFNDRKGRSLLGSLSSSPSWQTGSHWFESWITIARQISERERNKIEVSGSRSRLTL